MVIAGTADARQIINELAKLDIKVVATVTSKLGSELIGAHPKIEVCKGKLTFEDMACLIEDTSSVCLIDASHPFAREASINAINACEMTGIPYLRFERKGILPDDSGVLRVKNFEEAAGMLSKMKGNILLAVGSNHLEVFVKWIYDYKERLYVRVLPESSILKKCEDIGLTAGNIIAFKGPFTEEMNIEMIKHCNAAVLVTKDSGEAGGTGEKLAAAKKSGIPVILVERPDISYPMKTESIKEAVRFAKELVFAGGEG